MSYTGKGRAFLEWVQGWDGYVKLNGMISDEGDLSVVISPNSEQLTQYIDGTSEHVLPFALTAMFPFSSGNDETNIDANELMEGWCDWILQQEQTSNYPNFQPATVTEISPVDQFPYLAMTYQGEKLAKYQFQCKITYEA